MAKQKVGAPSTFSPELGKLICQMIAGGASLRHIEREGIAAVSTVIAWTCGLEPEKQEFQKQYAAAQQKRLEYWAEEIVEISDRTNKDVRTKADLARAGEEGKELHEIDYENIQRSRLMVDTRKWLMSKLNPRKYGDTAAVKLSGPDGGAVPVSHSIDAPLQETMEAWMARRSNNSDK